MKETAISSAAAEGVRFMRNTLKCVGVALAISSTICGFDLEAGTPPVPIKERIDAAKINNVKIYFCFDAHCKMNGRRDGKGYKRAFAGWKKVMQDSKNPLNGRFSTMNIQVNHSDIAYLIAPDEIVSFSVSNSELPKMRNLNRKDWSFQQFIDRISSDIKVTNAVICIISNNEVFAQPNGVVARDPRKNLTFFVLKAGDESINAGFFDPYWEDKAWEKFIRYAMGSNVNDIAEIVINDYYLLSDAEKKNFQKIECVPEQHTIKLKNLLLSKPKKMWKQEVTFNGKNVVFDQDANDIILQPAVGYNEITAALVSPVGKRYEMTWSGNNFTYNTLSRQEKEKVQSAINYLGKYSIKFIQDDIALIRSMYGKLDTPLSNLSKKRILETAELVNIDSDKIAKIEKLILEYQNKIMKQDSESKAELDKLKAKYNVAQGRQYDDLLTKLKDLGTKIEQKIELEIQLRDLELAKNALADKIQSLIKEYPADKYTPVDQLAVFLKKAQDASSRKLLDKLTKQVEAYISNIKPIKSAEQTEPSAETTFDKRKKAQIEECKKWIAANPDKADKIAALKECIKAIEACQDSLKYSQICKKIKEILDEKLSQDTFGEIKAQVLANIAEWKENNPDALEEINELDRIGKLIKKSRENNAEFQDLCAAAEEIMTPPSSSGGILVLILVLILLGAGFVMVKKLLNRKVAVLEIENPQSPGETQMVELQFNKAVNLNKFGCNVDLCVVCKKGENETIIYELSSGNQSLWYSSSNDSSKQKVYDGTQVNAGEYFIYESEVAMQENIKLKLAEITE